MFFVENHKHASLLMTEDSNVVKYFKSITKGYITTSEKMVACYNWVKDNINFVSEQQKKDVWQTPTETLKLKRGDCEDHALLLTTFFLLAESNAFFARGYFIGSGGYHAFVLTLNEPKFGLNYWDSTEQFSPTPLMVLLEIINQNGIVNPLGFANFIPTFLPLTQPM